MTPVQNLKFVEPTAPAFIEALTAMDTAKPILLVGGGNLAHDIKISAMSAGLKLIARTKLPRLDALARFHVIIFTELEGEVLGQLLLTCLDLEDVSVIAPITSRHFTRLPLFIVSIPKAGTHLLYELAQALGYAPGVELPDFPRPQTWYCVEYSNSHTVAKDFFVDTVRRSPFGNRHHPFSGSPALFAYRHPFDVLVSEAHYYQRDGKTAFAGYFDGLNFEDRVRRLVDDEWLLGSLRQRMGGFLPWLDFPNVIAASFEELVGDAGGGSTQAQYRLIWSIMLKLQVDGCVADIAARVFNQDSPTFREGKIGAWRSELSPALIAELTEQCEDILEGYGYSYHIDANLLPEAARSRGERPLSYSTRYVDTLPITIVSDFMGCNLVRYDNRFYAIPLSAGKVALEEWTHETRLLLPSADTLSNLKSLLLIGYKAYAKQITQLNKAGDQIELKSTFPVYWREPANAEVLDEYNGYNIVYLRGIYIALRQSLGVIDLTKSLSELMAYYSYDDILVSHTAEELFCHIDKVSPAMCIASEMKRRETAYVERMGPLEGQVADLVSEMARRETAYVERMGPLEGQVADLVSEMARREAAYGKRMGPLERKVADLISRIEKYEMKVERRTGRLESRVHVLAHEMQNVTKRLESLHDKIGNLSLDSARVQERFNKHMKDLDNSILQRVKNIMKRPNGVIK